MEQNEHAPETPATKFLKTNQVFRAILRLLKNMLAAPRYRPRTGTLTEHAVVRTLVFGDENAKPAIVLMHGDRKGIDQAELARQINYRR